ncbi:permease [Paenibacillus sp. J22TS3]|uniref:permease n=1 Tax=Paenibacillus sp. J22TS3 TaxID=2807192 RepID=UPI001B0F29DF|nr:permease [Paenibacillus sp. J22TS3]GIP23731.1 membrane protein [Paenibacillus sp. J22TS3]
MSSHADNSLLKDKRPSGSKKVWFTMLFVIIAIAGLTYVKWWPYYFKALKAAAEHSIGSSILTGDQAAAPAPSFQSAWDYAVDYFKSVWKAAVLGILLGSLVQVLLPAKWLLKALGKAGFKSTALGGIASLPAMMCTCCAAPIAVGLRKKNVSVGAALAFWLGNPVLNPATLIFMTFVLSWKFTLMRIGFGLILTFAVSYFAGRLAGQAPIPEQVQEAVDQPEEPSGSFLTLWLRSVGTLLLTIVPAYLITVLVLGAARAWMFPALGAHGMNTVLAIVIFAIAGTLFVIPTAAEIPIIGTFLSFGFGTGVAGALLITLPSVSLPSLLMVYRSFPRRVVWFVTGSVIVLGLLCGAISAVIL